MEIYGILNDYDYKMWSRVIHDEKGKTFPSKPHPKLPPGFDGIGVKYVSFWILDGHLFTGVRLNTDDIFLRTCHDGSISQLKEYVRKNVFNTVPENILEKTQYFQFSSSHVGEYIGLFDNFLDRNKLFSDAA